MDTNDPNYSPYSNGFSGITGLPSPEQAEEASSYRTAAEQKRVEVRAKLDQLSQTVLDLIHEEQVFVSSAQYTRMMSLAKNGDPSDSEIDSVFSEIKEAEGGYDGFAGFLIKSMELPAKRKQAVQAYSEYRSMAESLGLLS